MALFPDFPVPQISSAILTRSLWLVKYFFRKFRRLFKSVLPFVPARLAFVPDSFVRLPYRPLFVNCFSPSFSTLCKMLAYHPNTSHSNVQFAALYSPRSAKRRAGLFKDRPAAIVLKADFSILRYPRHSLPQPERSSLHSPLPHLPALPAFPMPSEESEAPPL